MNDVAMRQNIEMLVLSIQGVMLTEKRRGVILSTVKQLALTTLNNVGKLITESYSKSENPQLTEQQQEKFVLSVLSSVNQAFYQKRINLLGTDSMNRRFDLALFLISMVKLDVLRNRLDANLKGFDKSKSSLVIESETRGYLRISIEELTKSFQSSYEKIINSGFIHPNSKITFKTL